MGANMARRLNDQGYRITAVHDQETTQTQALARELECEAAATPARVAEVSGIVITIVSDDAAMRSIYAEQNPDFKNRKPEEFIDHSLLDELEKEGFFKKLGQ